MEGRAQHRRRDPHRARLGGGPPRPAGGLTLAPLTSLTASETARLEALDLTYPVLDGVPEGYRWFSASAVIGSGEVAFADAAEAVLTWQVQRRSGITVAASASPVELGTVAALVVPVGPLRLRAWCRVVEVIEEPQRRGFAYGTLPGHPESGKEWFVVSREDDGVVRLTIEAFSRPAAWFARLGGPVSRALQDAMTRSYLRALTR